VPSCVKKEYVKGADWEWPADRAPGVEVDQAHVLAQVVHGGVAGVGTQRHEGIGARATDVDGSRPGCERGGVVHLDLALAQRHE
jgi:hypothetical protein